MSLNTRYFWTILVWARILSSGILGDTNDCLFIGTTYPVSTILCAVQYGKFFIDNNAKSVKNAGCLLGGKGSKRCNAAMHVPTALELPRSPPPPDAKIKEYQALATIAEKIIPQTYFRQGFSHDFLLLSHNDTELPRKQFDVSRIRNKKLKNIVQCVTRQQFIRKSFSFDTSPENNKCKAMSERLTRNFLSLWLEEKDHFSSKVPTKDALWVPSKADDGQLLVSALEVLDYFYQKHGGVWTGCFDLDDSSSCRGALAAASLVVSIHILYEAASKHKEFSESSFVAGYMLASLGRGLLHGDLDSTGDAQTTLWKVRLMDFIGLQAAYMKLYIESFGKLYNEQLAAYVPLVFKPDFPVLKNVASNLEFRAYSQSLEPIYTSLRNWMFTEASNLIDFGPYRTLVSFPEVRLKLQKRDCRRVLIDVGANGFYASPKYLLDSYAPFLPFTHAIMIEPEPHFSAEVPPSYKRKYNITHLQIYAEVATGSETDMVKLLPKLVTKEDFVVLKFDVDPNRFAQGPTMEWGFLFSLMMYPEVVQLVDELYIELHFHFPALSWRHYHSNWEALDTLRYLREQGVVVHSWP